MTNNTITQNPTFSDEAIRLWELQERATDATTLAIYGEQVDSRRFVLRQEQAEAARTSYQKAVEAAQGTPAFDDYLALLRFRATL